MRRRSDEEDKYDREKRDPLKSHHGYIILLIIWFAIFFTLKNGNGKTHRTPSPAGLQKIKRVSLELFLSLQALVNNVKVIKLITPRGYQKKSKVLKLGRTGVVIDTRPDEYRPSKIASVLDSQLWRWRRVNEWDRYINDPVEKLNGHIKPE